MTLFRPAALIALILAACGVFALGLNAASAQTSTLPTEFVLDGFPDVIEVRAQAPATKVTDASLQLRLLPAGEVTVVDAAIDAEHLSAVIQTAEPTAGWEWLPVGAQLEYVWTLNGEQTSPTTWQYLDPRYDWGRAERDGLTLVRPGSHLRADELAGHGVGALDLVVDLLETPVEQPIAVVVWPSTTAAAGGIPTALFGAQPPPIPRMTVAQRHGEQIIYVFRDTGGSVREAVIDAVVDAAAHPHAEAVPMWIRFALGLWSQGPINGLFLRRAGAVVIIGREDYYSFEELETFPVTW